MNNSRYLVITGASRGIGEETARQFVHAGWKVVNLSRTPCAVAGVTNITVDLAALTEPGCNTVKQQLQALLPSSAIIALVHNAAVCHSDTVENAEIAAFQHTMAVNVAAPLQLTQLLRPWMQPGSSIIYIGSTLSEKAVPGWMSYITSKHAVVGLMKATCQDLAGKHIHTCCICPGITETEMLQQRFKTDPTLVDTLSALSCENRLIQPHEIAELIYFAATHPVINGAVLHANLGQKER